MGPRGLSFAERPAGEAKQVIRHQLRTAHDPAIETPPVAQAELGLAEAGRAFGHGAVMSDSELRPLRAPRAVFDHESDPWLARPLVAMRNPGLHDKVRTFPLTSLKFRHEAEEPLLGLGESADRLQRGALSQGVPFRGAPSGDLIGGWHGREIPGMAKIGPESTWKGSRIPRSNA